MKEVGEQEVLGEDSWGVWLIAESMYPQYRELDLKR